MDYASENVTTCQAIWKDVTKNCFMLSQTREKLWQNFFLNHRLIFEEKNEQLMPQTPLVQMWGHADQAMLN